MMMEEQNTGKGLKYHTRQYQLTEGVQMSKKDNILQHLADIDFRTKEERQKHAVDDFKGWYDALTEQQDIAYSETIQAQMTLLSSVLWYLMPHKEYKKFMKRDAKADVSIQML